MIYGVTFINSNNERKHSYEDWGLLQVGAAFLAPPAVQTHYIQVPGMDGQIDATESLDGYVHFNAREFKGTYKCTAPREYWKAVYSSLQRYLHGKAVRAIFDDDKRHYVKGRFEVGSPRFEKQSFTVEIRGTVDPYRYMLYTSLSDWEWDPFVFEDDIAWDYEGIEVDGALTVQVVATEMPVIPTFYVVSEANDVKLKVGSTQYTLPRGKSVLPNLIIKDKTYAFRFTGHGKVDIEFEGGEL